MEAEQLATQRQTHLAAPLWQDIAARLEKIAVKVRHVDAHIPKSRATEEHQNNQQVDQAAKIEVAQVDLDWQRKGELFIARWAHDTSGHQGRDATYRWACDRGVELAMDTISEVIHQCETCAAIKQAKQLKPLWYGGRWLKYKYGEAWQIDYITLPQTRQVLWDGDENWKTKINLVGWDKDSLLGQQRKREITTVLRIYKTGDTQCNFSPDDWTQGPDTETCLGATLPPRPAPFYMLSFG
ncbi:hypothetical protein GRJ2_003327700 [Grus japonensis]|uniref:Integrase zinc-binding domain-containing protein n=1 Tax=Grus japonensis TaxID=30415 RepID=A0ABC9YH51_GRUJA